jgi:gas vesicle protein
MKIRQIIGFFAGLLSGGIVGAAVVILLAPRSGSETRQALIDKVNDIIDTGKEAVEVRRQELRGQYETAIQIPLAPVEQESA